MVNLIKNNPCFICTRKQEDILIPEGKRSMDGDLLRCDETIYTIDSLILYKPNLN